MFCKLNFSHDNTRYFVIPMCSIWFPIIPFFFPHISIYRFVDTISHSFHNQVLRGLRPNLYTHSYRVILLGFSLDTMVCVTWYVFEAGTVTIHQYTTLYYSKFKIATCFGCTGQPSSCRVFQKWEKKINCYSCMIFFLTFLKHSA